MKSQKNGAREKTQPFLAGMTCRPRAPLLGPQRLRPGDHVELGHPVQHDVAALERPVGGVRRVVAGGVLHQSGQHRRLAQVEVLRVLVEVVPGGRLHAERAVAEVGDVEVALEDPVLGVVLLEGDRVAQLAQLARVGVVGRGLALGLGAGLAEQGELDHLLGDGRATLDHAVAGLVGDEGAQRALQVEGPVLVEAVVLDRHDRLHHRPRDLVERDADAVLVVQGGDDVAAAVHDPRLLRQRLGLQLCGQAVHRLRDVTGTEAQDACERDGQTGDDDAHDGGDSEHHAEMGGDATGRRALGVGRQHASNVREHPTPHRFVVTPPTHP